MPSSESVAARLAGLFRVFGQNVGITHGGVATTLRCRVSTLNLSVRAIYFATTETAGWAHPGWQLTIAGDYSALAVGDAVTLDSGISGLKVRGWDRTRLGDSVVKTVVFVAADG